MAVVGEDSDLPEVEGSSVGDGFCAVVMDSR